MLGEVTKYVKEYLDRGSFSEKLKSYDSVSIGWFGVYQTAYQK